MNNIERTQEKTGKLEREIKKLILLCALYLQSRQYLFVRLNVLIQQYAKTLPKELIDRDKYILGAQKSAVFMINHYLEPFIYAFKPTKDYKKPIDLVKNIKKLDKAEPNVQNYEKIMTRMLKGLNKSELVYREDGKKPISLWQKAELDVRHEAQMKMVQKCYESNIDLWWLSSHTGCSKRCEKWQGKLVSLSLPPIDASFFTGKIIENHKVYSFTAIENVIDQYGYKNNIINGFNCRHSMIKYEKGKKPKLIDTTLNDKVRELESKQREMERAIRKKNKEHELLKIVNEDKAKILYGHIKRLNGDYRRFCKKWGLNIEEYRIV